MSRNNESRNMYSIYYYIFCMTFFVEKIHIQSYQTPVSGVFLPDSTGAALVRCDAIKGTLIYISLKLNSRSEL